MKSTSVRRIGKQAQPYAQLLDPHPEIKKTMFRHKFWESDEQDALNENTFSVATLCLHVIFAEPISPVVENLIPSFVTVIMTAAPQK